MPRRPVDQNNTGNRQGHSQGRRQAGDLVQDQCTQSDGNARAQIGLAGDAQGPQRLHQSKVQQQCDGGRKDPQTDGGEQRDRADRRRQRLFEDQGRRHQDDGRNQHGAGCRNRGWQMRKAPGVQRRNRIKDSTRQHGGLCTDLLANAAKDFGPHDHDYANQTRDCAGDCQPG